MAFSEKSAGLGVASGSAAPTHRQIALTPTEPVPTALDIDQARTLIGEIASCADALKQLICSVAESLSASENDRLAVATNVASQGLAEKIGWAADVAVKKLGGGQVVGGAEEWMLPPIYSKGSYRVRGAEPPARPQAGGAHA